MNLSKAIEIINDHLHSYNSGYPKDLRDAIKLGSEALERVKWHKDQHQQGYYDLLPSETEN